VTLSAVCVLETQDKNPLLLGRWSWGAPVTDSGMHRVVDIAFVPIAKPLRKLNLICSFAHNGSFLVYGH